MTARGINAPRLAEITGLSKSAIHFILNGTTQAKNVRAMNLDAIAEALSANREWLLYGRGRMDGETQPASQPVGLNPAILQHADYWVHVEEELQGKASVVPPDRRDDYLRRLAHVYSLAEADGGRLSPAHADQFMREAQGVVSNERGHAG